MKEISLYVHVPYCNSKCHFCSYVSHIKTEDLIRQQSHYGDYVEALKKQIRAYLPSLREKGYGVRSMYFGGGTPTSLSTDQLVDIIQTIKQNIDLSPNYIDTTLETTPENTTNHDFTRLREAGYDRISMGVQSMIDARLKRLGRCHSTLQVSSALERFRQAGFDNINVDLMIALPDETNEELQLNLEDGLKLGTNHYTVYMFVPTPNTTFLKKMKRVYTEEELCDKYFLARNIMENNSFKENHWQYFSLDKRRCISDSTYFSLVTEWLAFGSTGNSLLQNKVIMGPAHHKDFINDPLRPGSVYAPSKSKPYLELHYSWAIMSERGLDLKIWEEMLGISFQNGMEQSVEIDAWHHYLKQHGMIKEENNKIVFVDSNQRTKYACKRLAMTYDMSAINQFYNQYSQFKPSNASSLHWVSQNHGLQVQGA